MNNRKKETRLLVLILVMLVVLLIGVILIALLVSHSDNPEPVTEDAAVESEEPSPTPTPTPLPLPTPTERVTPKPTPSPTPEPDPTPTPKSNNGFIVAIDAGHQLHGDSSTEPIGPGSSSEKAKVSDGATGVSTGVPEYDLNLSVAKRLERELTKRGYQVYMIRTKNNVDISNIERAQAANDSGADICIRLHADGIDDNRVHGASALYPSQNNPYVARLSKKSQTLSRCVLNAYCETTGISNRGLSERDDLTGTNWSEIPVTLLEMGFLSNAAEDEKMNDPDFQIDMAIGIANGIDKYFKE